MTDLSFNIFGLFTQLQIARYVRDNPMQLFSPTLVEAMQPVGRHHM
jgi:hypothetical protein